MLLVRLPDGTIHRPVLKLERWGNNNGRIPLHSACPTPSAPHPTLKGGEIKTLYRKAYPTLKGGENSRCNSPPFKVG